MNTIELIINKIKEKKHYLSEYTLLTEIGYSSGLHKVLVNIMHIFS